MENMKNQNKVGYTRRYLWVEIPTDNHIVCDGLRMLIKALGINSEASGCYDLTHFENYVSELERDTLDAGLDLLWDLWNESKVEMDGKMCISAWKVYGIEGHRQRESFNQSYFNDFSEAEKIEQIIVFNNDILNNNNEYTLVIVISNSYDDCERIFEGQLSDGIFENSNTGKIVKIR